MQVKNGPNGENRGKKVDCGQIPGFHHAEGVELEQW